MHERTKRLRQLMDAHRLKSTDVARIMGCSEQTVRIWRCKNADRIIPAQSLRLLELEVSAGARGAA